MIVISCPQGSAEKQSKPMIGSFIAPFLVIPIAERWMARQGSLP
jgi:hypothetical protein